MHKWLMMLGLLITLATIWIRAHENVLKGTPKQGIAKPGSGQSGQQKAEPQDNGSPAPKPQVAVIQASTPIDEAAKAEARENLKIQRELALFTGLLVFVGFLQIGTMYYQARLLRGTLNEIHVQAGHMGEQTTAAEKAAGAAEISAKAAMGVAVPTVALHKFSFVVSKESAATFYKNPRVRIELKNYGQSPAFLHRYAVGFSWDEHSPRKFTPYPFEDKVIDAGGTYAFEEIELEVFDATPEEVIEDLVRGKRHLVFSGWISYRDVFGSPLRKLTLYRELTEYDPEWYRMTVMDTSPLSLKLWTNPEDD